jgi:hypothetical protein
MHKIESGSLSALTPNSELKTLNFFGTRMNADPRGLGFKKNKIIQNAVERGLLVVQGAKKFACQNRRANSLLQSVPLASAEERLHTSYKLR